MTTSRGGRDWHSARTSVNHASLNEAGKQVVTMQPNFVYFAIKIKICELTGSYRILCVQQIL